MGCEQVFVQQLRERGFRLTLKREIILSVLHDVEGLATAEEIYSQVQRISTSVDISTVYRTLDLLQEFDLVSCVDPPDDQRRYELLGIHGPHLHLVCQACGQITGAIPHTDQLALQPHLINIARPIACIPCQDTENWLLPLMYLGPVSDAQVVSPNCGCSTRCDRDIRKPGY